MSQPLPQADQPAVHVAGLTRRFGPFAAVDSVSFDVARGEILGLIGPNGAGKSTLMKMLTTLLPPTSGVATVAGFDIVRQPSLVRARIGYVPQLVSVDGSLTGQENMLLSARLYGIPMRERKERIAAALDMMGLSDFAGHLVQRYSGGMIRRLEVALSMLHRPSVLFMDEPTVGLDPAARDTVWSHVIDLKRSSRMTLVVSSHYMEEVEELCDRIALMAAGRLVAIGSAAELKAGIGPGASLDDVFLKLAAGADREGEKSYADVKHTRRDAHG